MDTHELFTSHALVAQFTRGEDNRLNGIIECYGGDILLYIDGFSLLTQDPEGQRKFMVYLGLIDRAFPRSPYSYIVERFPGLFDDFAFPSLDNETPGGAQEKVATLKAALKAHYRRNYTDKKSPGFAFLFTTTTFPLGKLDELRAFLTEKYGEGEIVGDVWARVRRKQPQHR